MDFKQLVLSETEKKFQDMNKKTTEKPIKKDIHIETSSTYKENRNNYVDRLIYEKTRYNSASADIQQKRRSRQQREEAEERERIRRKEAKQLREKQNTITISIVLPIVVLIFLSIGIIIDPIAILSRISFAWTLVIYIISFLIFVIFSIVFFRRSSYEVNDYICISQKVRGFVYLLGSIAFLVCMIVGVSQSQIKISNAYQLDNITCLPNGGANKNYILTNDIDYQGETCKMWGKTLEFNGTFDGNNHKISNVKVETTTHHVYHDYYISNPGATYTNGSSVECAGFVVKNRGTIKNIHFDNIEMKYTPTARFNMVGLVAGENTGKIENCILTNCQIIEKRSEISENKNSVSYVGGVVGYNRSGTVQNIAFITDKPVYDIIGKIWTAVIAGESDSGVFSNILVYKKPLEISRMVLL